MGPEVLWRCTHAQELHAGLDTGQKGPLLGEGVRIPQFLQRSTLGRLLCN